MPKLPYSYVFAIPMLLVFASVGARAQNNPSSLRFQPTASSSSIISAGTGVYPNGSVLSVDGTEIAENAAMILPDAPAADAQTAQAAEPPPRMRQTAQDIKYEARRWHLGGRIGAGFSPELFMFGVQSQIGPIFSSRFLLRPNVDFSFGELTDMFALNLEGAYRLRTAVYRRWTPYFGMGPSLNFIHQGTSTSDVSFSDFTYKTGFNVFVGAQKGKTFVEMKTALWSGPAPVLRLVLGYNF